MAPGYYNASVTTATYHGKSAVPPQFRYPAMHRRRTSNAQSCEVPSYQSHPSTGEPFMFQYVPAVSGLSSAGGSAGGGLLLTVTGRGFVAGLYSCYMQVTRSLEAAGFNPWNHP